MSVLICMGAAQSIPAFASESSSKIPAYMAPGTVIQYDSNKEMKVIEKGDTSKNLKAKANNYKPSSNLPEIKPDMTVIYDALGGPIVSMKKSDSDLNTSKNEKIATLSSGSNEEQGYISNFDIWKELRVNGTATGDAAADGAAHQTLPLYAEVGVYNEENNWKSTDVRILDRGPYVDGRILDMSEESFSKVANLDDGLFYGAIFS